MNTGSIVKQPSLVFSFVACPDGEPVSTSPGHAPPSSLRESRASREFYFRWLPQMRERIICSLKRGSRAPFGAERTVPWQGARDRLASRPRRNGAPLRRLKSLGPRCPLTPAWPFGSGRGHGPSPRRLFYAGRPIQGLPGPRSAKIVGAGAAPPSHLARLRRRPSQ